MTAPEDVRAWELRELRARLELAVDVEASALDEQTRERARITAAEIRASLAQRTGVNP